MKKWQDILNKLNENTFFIIFKNTLIILLIFIILINLKNTKIDFIYENF